jgi:hypothetical protein
MATVTPFPTPAIPPAGIAYGPWITALDAAYATAQKAMPDAGERLERALGLVRKGSVAHAAEFGQHHYTVVSESDPAGLTTYHVHAQAPQSCTCEDWTHQGGQRKGAACKHLLATWLYRRTLEHSSGQWPVSSGQQGGDSPSLGRVASGQCAVASGNRETSSSPLATSHESLATPLPEAALSLCLKGRMGGVDTQLTIRGQTRAEFMRHLQDVLDLSEQLDAVRGLFDAPVPRERGSETSAQPVEPPASEWVCAYHGKGLPSKKVPGGRYCPAKMADGSHCKEQWSPK